jgi:hypothetical protein
MAAYHSPAIGNGSWSTRLQAQPRERMGGRSVAFRKQPLRPRRLRQVAGLLRAEIFWKRASNSAVLMCGVFRRFCGAYTVNDLFPRRLFAAFVRRSGLPEGRSRCIGVSFGTEGKLLNNSEYSVRPEEEDSVSTVSEEVQRMARE